MANPKKRLAKDSGAASRARGTPTAPLCPMHRTRMKYEPEKLFFRCTYAGCKQISMPEVEAEKGKPLMVRGELELTLVDDPEGSKDGRIFVRPIDGNIFVDVTDYIVRVKEKATTGVRLILDFEHVTDTRKRGK